MRISASLFSLMLVGYSSFAQGPYIMKGRLVDRIDTTVKTIILIQPLVIGQKIHSANIDRNGRFEFAVGLQFPYTECLLTLGSDRVFSIVAGKGVDYITINEKRYQKKEPGSLTTLGKNALLNDLLQTKVDDYRRTAAYIDSFPSVKKNVNAMSAALKEKFLTRARDAGGLAFELFNEQYRVEIAADTFLAHAFTARSPLNPATFSAFRFEFKKIKLFGHHYTQYYRYLSSYLNADVVWNFKKTLTQSPKENIRGFAMQQFIPVSKDEKLFLSSLNDSVVNAVISDYVLDNLPDSISNKIRRPSENIDTEKLCDLLKRYYDLPLKTADVFKMHSFIYDSTEFSTQEKDILFSEQVLTAAKSLNFEQRKFMLAHLDKTVSSALVKAIVAKEKSDLDIDFSKVKKAVITAPSPQYSSFYPAKYEVYEDSIHFYWGSKQNVSQLISTLREKIPQHPLYFDVWATWCGPCIEQFKYAARAKAALKEARPVFVYLCIESEDRTLWKEYALKNKLYGIHLFLNQSQSRELKKLFNINGIPHYALISKSGKLLLDVLSPGQLPNYDFLKMLTD